MKLSIVIPCLNEAKTIGIVIQKCLNSIKKLNIQAEIIIADNGSNDNSQEIAKSLGAITISVPQKGYGSALKAGFAQANGEYILMGDADDSYNFDEIDDFILKMSQNDDFIIGTRLKGFIEKGAMPFLHRYLGTPVLTFIINLIFKTKISDCNCGMRCFKKELIQKLHLESNGMEIASEMLIKVGLLKAKITEIPISLYKDKRDRKPHLNTWRDGWRHLRLILLYSPTYLYLLPGLIFMAIGALLMTILINGPVEVLTRTVDYHTALFGSLFTLLGFQILTIGIQAKAYAQLKEFKVTDQVFNKFNQIFSLEKGIIMGIILCIIGLALNILVIKFWINAGYKNLNQASLLSFASTLIILGLQTIFTSFSLSFHKN